MSAKKVGIWLVVAIQSSAKTWRQITYVNTVPRVLTEEWCSNCIKINGDLTTLHIWAKHSQISSNNVAMPSLLSINHEVNNKSSCGSSSYCKQQQTPAITVKYERQWWKHFSTGSTSCTRSFIISMLQITQTFARSWPFIYIKQFVCNIPKCKQKRVPRHSLLPMPR